MLFKVKYALFFTAITIFTGRSVSSFTYQYPTFPRETVSRPSKALKMATTTTKSNLKPTSTRVNETLDPCVVLMKQLINKHQSSWDDKDEKIYSLAQGVVYWTPPSTVSEAMVDAIHEPDDALHSYAPDEGLPELVSAIKEKLANENNLDDDAGTEVIITSGANQAYMNCVLTLLSEGDLSVIFTPYYFK